VANLDNIELDLDKIRKYGQTREEENFEFRAFLKWQDPDEVDRIVHELNREVSERIDCTTCGNCCKSLQPSVTEQDVEKISKRLQIPTEQVKNDFTETEDGEQFFKHLPCSFLSEKKCTVYEDRPETCRSFPHLHKDDFTSRLFKVIANYSVCPIVFNVFERLKKEFHFK